MRMQVQTAAHDVCLLFIVRRCQGREAPGRDAAGQQRRPAHGAAEQSSGSGGSAGDGRGSAVEQDAGVPRLAPLRPDRLPLRASGGGLETELFPQSA